MMRPSVLGIVMPIAMCACAGCASVNPKLKASGYYDTRNLPTGTVTVTNVDSKHGNSIFAYVDLETHSKVPKYHEANITQRIFGGLGGLVEYDRNFNVSTGLHRFGFAYQIPLPEALSRDKFAIKYTPFSTHHHGSQPSVSGAMLIGPDIIADGYLDYNFKEYAVTEGGRSAGESRATCTGLSSTGTMDRAVVIRPASDWRSNGESDSRLTPFEWPPRRFWRAG